LFTTTTPRGPDYEEEEEESEELTPFDENEMQITSPLQQQRMKMRELLDRTLPPLSLLSFKCKQFTVCTFASLYIMFFLWFQLCKCK
jgi:hypothetical protein